MTREEAINKLVNARYADEFQGDEELTTAHLMAIKALEQESNIDKIRAEIEQNAYPIVHGVNNHEKGMTLYGVLQIIDKYIAESEE